MRKFLTTLISLVLIAIFSFQAMPVLAADPTELNLTIEDVIGQWNGQMEYLFEKSTGHFAALSSLPQRVNDVEFTLWNKMMVDPESDLTLGLGSYGIGSVYLEEDGSFYGLENRSPSRSLELLGKFEIEGTRILFKGIIKEKVWDMPGSGPDEGTQEISLTGSKEGPASLSPATTEEPINFGIEIEKGHISFIQGRAYIHRNAKIIPATMSESLMAGDLLVMDEGEMTIEGNEGGSIKFVGRTRFQLPEEVGVKKTPPSAIAKILGDIWTKTKEFVRGESFEVQVPTGTCGVRG